MTKKPKSASEIATLDSDRRDAIKELGNQIAYNEGYQEHIGDLLNAMKPFVQLVKETDGRIPSEKLSFADWHTLAKAFDYTASCLDSDEKIIDRGNQIFALQNEIRGMARERDELLAAAREALAKADEAIALGQACSSESEFARWRNESQSMRPHGDLIALAQPTPDAGEKQPPAHAFEVRISIGGEDWDYVVRTLKELSQHIPEHGPTCGLCSGGAGGSHSVTIHQRDVTPEQYHVELQEWLKGHKASKALRAAGGGGEGR